MRGAGARRRAHGRGRRAAGPRGHALGRRRRRGTTVPCRPSSECWGRHEARRHPPHHRDHRRRAAQRRLLRPRARPADGQEDRQPGRPDRLPPLLRRRAGLRGRRPDVLRVPERARRAAPARAWSTGSRTASPPPTRSTSGPTGWASEGVATARGTTARCASPTPRASSTSCVVVDVPDAPLTARSTEVPEEHALQGFHAVDAAVADPRKSEAMLTDVLGFDGARRRRFEARGDARGGSIRFEGGAGPRLRRRRHDPPHRVGRDARRARRLARARRRRRAADHAR